MTKKSIKIEFQSYNSTEELEESLKVLLKKSESILVNAYAPYSNFKVSALCQMEGGVEVFGTNQENAAYPSGLCAERVAVFATKSKYPNKKIERIVITTAQSSSKPATPCGACRQVLVEYEQQQGQPIQLILKSGSSQIWKFKSIKDLLPYAFDSSILKKQ